MRPAPNDSTSRMRWLGRPTLTRQLFLIVIAFSLGPLVIFNTWGYLQSRHFWNESVIRDVRLVAQVQATKTLDLVKEQQRFLSTAVGSNPQLLSLVSAAPITADAASRQQLFDKVSTALAADARRRADLGELLVVSPQGRLLGSSSGKGTLGTDLSSDLCNKWQSEKPNIAGLGYGTAEPTLVMTAPLRTAGDTLIGILCARYRFGVHRELAAGHHELTTHASLYLLDAHGRVINSSNPGPSERNAAQPLEHLHPITVVSRPWSGRYHGDRDEVIAAFAPIPALNWGLLVEVPVDEALQALDEFKWQALGLSTVLTLLLTVAIFLTARTMAGHLGRVASAAKRMASGTLGERIAIRGPEEFVELATAFNQMSLALQSSHQSLEERIAGRTRELRESQELTELLLDSIDQRVIVVNKSCVIIKANRAARRMYGNILVGRDYRHVFADALATSDDGGTNTCVALITLSSGEPTSAERSEKTLAGQEIVHLESYPMLSPSGRVESVVEIGRVVTGERQMQAQLIHQEKMAAFGLLAAGVAHEIGNPLAAVQAQLRMTREAPEPERVAQTLDVVDKAMSRISRLLRELVDFARRRRDAVILVSVNQVVDDVARLLNHDPRARNIEIFQKLAPGLPGVRAREDHLVQVLLNLGINALDAMEGNGRLTFETSMNSHTITVRISDTGHGIPEQVRGRIFEPFFTTKAPEHGTGLGLFVTRSIVEELGGRIEIEHADGDGTTFAVHLDVTQQQASESAS